MHEGRWGAWALVAAIACSQSELEQTARPESPALTSSCAQDLFPGFATPQEAFATYAAALNEADYCRAANTYAREQRQEAATTSFAALALMAGATENPKQAAYRARFRQLCARYALPCDSDQRVTELARDLRAGKPMAGLEPKLPDVTKRVPEDVFSAVMKTLAELDPNAIGRLSPTLKDVKVQGERASALAERAGRPGTPAFMIKSAQGWMLALH